MKYSSRLASIDQAATFKNKTVVGFGSIMKRPAEIQALLCMVPILYIQSLKSTLSSVEETYYICWPRQQRITIVICTLVLFLGMSAKSDRYRAEIYAINTYLKKIEQNKFANLKKAFEDGEFLFDNASLCKSDDSSVERCHSSAEVKAKNRTSDATSKLPALAPVEKRRNVKTAPNPLPKIRAFGGV